MPEMDGFAFAERMRAETPHAMPPTIMLSSAGLQRDAARCRELGIATYLTKPVKQSELLEGDQRRHVGGHGHRPLRPRPGGGGDPRPARQRPLRVLVAEDNPVNQRLAIRLLEKQGHEPTVVGDGREALDALEAGTFDVVLMDMQMPNLDGLEATGLLRERERLLGLPRQAVVAMTAHAMKGDRERCLAAGCDEYVAKPIRPRDLFDAIDRSLALAAPRAEIATPSPAPEGRAGAPIHDRAAALEGLDGDEELLQDLAAVFLEDSPRLMAAVRQAVAEGDPGRLERAAHSLKGSVANFGARAASEAAMPPGASRARRADRRGGPRPDRAGSDPRPARAGTRPDRRRPGPDVKARCGCKS